MLQHSSNPVPLSCSRDNISGSASRISGNEEVDWLSNRMTGRLASGPIQPVSQSELWMYSVEAIDTIVLWRGGRRGIKEQQWGSLSGNVSRHAGRLSDWAEELL